MELLIVLGLCFGAYELLGVFQGCFQYNEHPLPYQPHHHHFNSGCDTKDDDEEELNESTKEQQEEGEEEEEGSEANEETDEAHLDSIKSGPCSVISTTDDVFDDDTRTILRSSKRPAERKRFVKPISKFTVSTSLMSLNRDESNLFNYIDDINNNHNKFYKFKGEEDEIAETSFDKIICSNESRARKWLTSDLALHRIHNEHSETSSSVNMDINNKKIFFISAAT